MDDNSIAKQIAYGIGDALTDRTNSIKETFNKITYLVSKTVKIETTNSKVEGRLNMNNYRTPGKGFCYFVQIDKAATKFFIEDIESIEGETIKLKGN